MGKMGYVSVQLIDNSFIMNKKEMIKEVKQIFQQSKKTIINDMEKLGFEKIRFRLASKENDYIKQKNGSSIQMSYILFAAIENHNIYEFSYIVKFYNSLKNINKNIEIHRNYYGATGYYPKEFLIKK